MGKTRVDLVHLLEDLRDAYPGSLEETIITEIIANSLDSRATTFVIRADPANQTLIALDNGTLAAPTDDLVSRCRSCEKLPMSIHYTHETYKSCA